MTGRSSPWTRGARVRTARDREHVFTSGERHPVDPNPIKPVPTPAQGETMRYHTRIAWACCGMLAFSVVLARAQFPSCRDFDRDGYGSPGNPSCPAGGLSDCDDAPPNGRFVNPGAVEVCDGIDNDCSGIVDDGACSGS